MLIGSQENTPLIFGQLFKVGCVVKSRLSMAQKYLMPFKKGVSFCYCTYVLRILENSRWCQLTQFKYFLSFMIIQE